MKFFRLDPEVAGGLTPMTVMDRSTHPPLVTRLHYEFDGWLGDEVLQSFPCFILTEQLAAKLMLANVTGISLDQVIITVSQEFRDMYGDRQIAPFKWMKVHGRPGADDFGIDRMRLILSKRSLDLLNLKHCEIKEWPAHSNGQSETT